MSDARKGLILGLLGVFLFAWTLPMTRLATGAGGPPQLDGLFIAMGRAVVAGGLSAIYLWCVRAAWPRAGEWGDLAWTTMGVVIGFPLLTSLALETLPAVHAAVIVGLLPLATAAIGAWVHRQRASVGFWVCAALGSVLVMLYAASHGHGSGGGLHLQWSDALLLGAVLCAAFGYVHGARLSQGRPPEQVISWALVLSLPLTLPVAWVARPTAAVTAAAWMGFAYVSLFSMWIGFFAWYRGLALGGTVRVSQLQLVQPFLSMLFAVPLLGETLGVDTLLFGLAVLTTVALGRRMPLRRPPAVGAASPPAAASTRRAAASAKPL